MQTLFKLYIQYNILVWHQCVDMKAEGKYSNQEAYKEKTQK